MLMKDNDTYEKTLNKFIMRACEVNSDIGNETMNKYLKLSNSGICAKIVTDIIMSTSCCRSERIQKLHEFVQNNIEKGSAALLEPFLERLCHLYFAI